MTTRLKCLVPTLVKTVPRGNKRMKVIAGTLEVQLFSNIQRLIEDMAAAKRKAKRA
jgi:hypothetical protein